MHPIIALQARLLAVLAADGALNTLIGPDAIFDAPPKGKNPPYVMIARHDLVTRDGDAAPSHEHRVLLQIWHHTPSRKTVLAIAERVIATVLAGQLSGASLTVTLCEHVRTDTAIDGPTGNAKAAVSFRLFAETS